MGQPAPGDHGEDVASIDRLGNEGHGILGELQKDVTRNEEDRNDSDRFYGGGDSHYSVHAGA